MEIIFGVTFGLIALGLTLFAAWLLDGWIDGGNIVLFGIIFILALVFVGFGFIALVLLGIIIGSFFGFLGSN